MEPLKLGFLASHNGSSMRAIVQAAARGELRAEPCVVISNNADAQALVFAREHGIKARHISGMTEGGQDAADNAIAQALAEARVDWVILSGYMRKIGPITLKHFAGKLINVHPALLPRHGGQGMYGDFVHRAVIEQGDAVSGATVHFVDEAYDQGPIIAQQSVPVAEDETLETLKAKVMAIEPELYIRALKGLGA